MSIYPGRHLCADNVDFAVSQCRGNTVLLEDWSLGDDGDFTSVCVDGCCCNSVLCSSSWVSRTVSSDISFASSAMFIHCDFPVFWQEKSERGR